ncbi:hypothetical protein FOA43_000159 [Brettanomyces nanus]|uniref:non-specific serine/threonine protein kinase n=1 Tax=Eeniella nana TaxID=13502 RepID=A0A875RSU0_EENNA|nr:uncharacterized protein FOA43_000159 [Brettanomyces nanus]QPG72857.1 hypothetical protein FOA43_000159 [Brettanomyces nanus]
MPSTPPQTPVFDKGRKPDLNATTNSLFDVSTFNSTTLDEDDTLNENKDQNPYYSPTSPVALSEFLPFSCDKKEPQEQKTPTTSFSYDRYPLKSERLRNFVLSSSVFHIRLVDRLGKGTNSYVFEAIMSSQGGSELEVAVKIPVSRSRVKSLERETEFMLLLKNFRLNSNENSDTFPFVIPYGLYYLNRESFVMMRKRDELPCLVMKKMDCTLTDYIRVCGKSALPEHIVISEELWWYLCGVLLHALRILRVLSSVHCDLKTDNVLVSLQKNSCSLQFKVSDFSSSSRVEDMDSMLETTPQFAPPELLNTGDPLARACTQTDLFSCGLILLNAATGKAPYQAYSYDQFYMISLVKENKALELLDRESINILRKNTAISQLIHMIVKDRCTLDSAVDYFHQHQNLGTLHVAL